MAQQTRENLPDLLLERLLVGDLPPTLAAQVRQRLAQQPKDAQRLEDLCQQGAALLRAHPPEQFAAQVAQKLEARRLAARAAMRPHVWGVPVLAALAALLVLALPRPATRGDLKKTHEFMDAEGGVRSKGLLPHLVVYRQAAAGPERLQPQVAVHPRDLLQLGYVAAGRPYGVIVSIDGRGAVTQHFPTAGGSATLLPERERTLPQAYELDDAPGFERFFLVTSQRPLALRAVLEAAARLARSAQARTGRLDLGADVEESSVLLPKAVP